MPKRMAPVRAQQSPRNRMALDNEKPRSKARFFYAVVPVNACHQRFRWPVTMLFVTISRGGVRLMTQPGTTDDLLALEPHELPR